MVESVIDAETPPPTGRPPLSIKAPAPPFPLMVDRIISNVPLSSPSMPTPPLLTIALSVSAISPEILLKPKVAMPEPALFSIRDCTIDTAPMATALSPGPSPLLISVFVREIEARLPETPGPVLLTIPESTIVRKPPAAL
jgi:hypothetical protein